MTQCKLCIKVEVLMCIYNFSAINGWTLCGETPLDVLVAEIDRRQSHQWSPVWLRNPVRLSVCLLWILRFCVSTAKRWKSGRSCWCLPNCWCRHAHSTASFICPPPLQEQSVAQKHFDTHVRNGARALQTNFCSSIGSNLLLLKRSGEWEGRSLLYLNHHPQKKTYFHRSTGLLFNIIINSYISNHYIKKVEKKSHNNHHFAQQTWSIKHFKLTHMTFCCMSRAQNSLELGVETSERRDIKITEGRLRPKTVWSQIGQRAIGWTWCTNPDGTEVPALMVKDIT